MLTVHNTGDSRSELPTFVAPDVRHGRLLLHSPLPRLPRLLADGAGLGQAQLQQEVEVVEGAVLADQMSEVNLRVSSVEMDLGLAEYADNSIGRVGRPVSIHCVSPVVS